MSNQSRLDAINAAKRHVESLRNRIEHADQMKRKELRKRLKRVEDHLKKLKGKAYA